MIIIFGKKQKGFTLMELIVVISVIGILVLIAIPNFIGYTQEAKLSQIKNDVKAVEEVIDKYLILNTTLPEDLDEFDYAAALDEGKIYSKFGLITNLEDTYVDVTNMKEVKAVNSKLKGNFIANNNGDVYYVAVERVVVKEEEENDLVKVNPIPKEWLNKDYPKFDISANGSYVFNENSIYAFGYNGWGQLGSGDIINKNTPIPINELQNKDIIKILGGEGHSFAIDRNGDVYAFGKNNFGQLGLGHNINQLNPIKNEVLSDFTSKDIKTGYNHNLLIEDGKLYSWGDNSSGQLGLGDTTNRNTPTEISLFSNVYEKPNNIFITANSSYFLGKNSIYSFGLNSNGQLGLGDSTNRNIPNTINTLQDKDVVKILGGEGHSYAVGRNGDVYAFGKNNYGQLGLGNNAQQTIPVKNTTLSNFTSKDIKAGYNHNLLVEDNKLYAWGYNGSGQLGLGDTINRNTPTEITFFSTIYEKPKFIFPTSNSSYFLGESSIYAFGHNGWGQLGLGDTANRKTPNAISSLQNKNIVKIIGGEGHSYAVSRNGDVYAFGRNDYGQLGLGNNAQQTTPVKNTTLSNFISKDIKAGYNHNLLVEDGKLYAWGYNGYGQLGLGDTVNRNTPTEVEFFSNNNVNIKNAYAGYNNNFVTTTDNRLYVWGNNSYRKLGLETSTNQLTPAELLFFRGVPIKDIKTQPNATFVLTEDGRLYSWGYNYYGQLGIGGNSDRSSPQLVNVDNKPVDKIITGLDSTIAITTDGSVYGWGRNYYSELGITGQEQRIPKKLTHIENLNPVDIKMGNYHIIITTQSEEIYVFGRNDLGQVGFESYSKISIPMKLYYFENTTIKNAYAGYNHNFVATTDNRLYVWGSNGEGELGLGVNRTNQISPAELLFFRGLSIKDIKTNERSTFILTEDGILYSVGFNANGQLGVGSSAQNLSSPQLVNVDNKPVDKIITGLDSTIAITTDGSIYGWGANSYSVLGPVGSPRTPVKLTHIENLNPIDIKMGNNHTIIKTKNEDIYVFGRNDLGQLGLEGHAVISSPTKLFYFENIVIKNAYAGYNNNFVTTTDNRLYVWGNNSYRKLGLETSTNQLTPAELLFFRGIPIKDIKTQANATFVLTEDGRLYSWGYNYYGQLGIGGNSDRSSPQLVNVDNKPVDKIITGLDSTIAITKDGSIYGWGRNYYSELGITGQEQRIPKKLTHIENLNPVDIKMGNYHTMVKTQNGDVYAFGRNDLGQLGLGHNNSPISTPTKLNLNFIPQ